MGLFSLLALLAATLTPAVLAATSVVTPKSILSDKTTGGVSNPSGLVDGSAVTVLTRNSDSDPVPSVIVDFGQNVVGYLSIDFAGSTNATASFPGLKLAFSETQQYLTDKCDFTRSDNGPDGNTRITPGTDQVQVRNDAFTWTGSWGCLNEGNVCGDGLHAFRYVKISLDAYEGDAPDVASTGTVSINSVSLHWFGYLGTADTFTGYFDCSDTGLTQLWYDGVYTVDMGTAEFSENTVDPRSSYSDSLKGKQVMYDGAKRDRDPYVGDLAVAGKTSYVSHNFSQSSMNIIADLADHQRDDGWIPPASINDYTLNLFDYPLHWVVATVDYVMYTGDTSFTDKYWTNLQRALDGYYAPLINSNGLLDKTPAINMGDYAFLPRTGPITYYNALYVYAMRYAAQLAAQIGRDDDAGNWNQRADRISTALVGRNLDSTTGAFFDGGPCPNQPDGTICNSHAQDGNGLAIVANITNPDQSNDVLNYYAEAAGRAWGNAFYDNAQYGEDFDQRVYAFVSFFEITARLQTRGQTSSGLDQIRRMYGWMAANDPKITMWEGIGPDGSPYEQGFTSMSHGWSTGIVSILTNHILGVTPTGPGFKTWIISPVIQDTGVTWAKGSVPSPHGPINVSWTTDNKILDIIIEAPDGTQGTIFVPSSGFDSWSVQLNGQDVSHASNVFTK